MSNTSIRFAVVGLGHIGKRHADMIMAHDACELVAIVDINEQVAAQNYNVPFFSSLDDFLASDIKAEVINIATTQCITCPSGY